MTQDDSPFAISEIIDPIHVWCMWIRVFALVGLGVIIGFLIWG